MSIFNSQNGFNLEIKSKVLQTIDYILNHKGDTNKETLRVMLKQLSYDELKEVTLEVEINNKKKFDILIDASKDLSRTDCITRKSGYHFQTKAERDFKQKLNNAKYDLDTGNFIAFLIRHYLIHSQKQNSILNNISSDLLDELTLSLTQEIAVLSTEFDNQLYIPSTKALFVFFLYDKSIATNYFRSIIRSDLQNKRTSLFELEYQVRTERFFARIGLNYIPKIILNNNKIELSDESSSIKKTEIFNIIDKDDYFKQKIPLQNHPQDRLINPHKDIQDIDKFKQILSAIFDKFIEEKDKKNSYKLSEIFYENITNPYPKYSDHQLIQAKEIIKKMFSKDNDFELYFFYFIHEYMATKRLKNWSAKFPILLNCYLDKMHNFGVTKIKKYTLHKDSNPVSSYNKEIQSFLNVFDKS